MMNMWDAMKVVEAHRGNAIVIPTMQARQAWGDVSDRPELDLPLTGCMGKASSLGLGVALALPERKVIVVDGDGSLLMNLGTLATIAEKSPKNLIHLSLENGMYAVVGGPPIPGANIVGFAGLAKEAGYSAIHDFDNLEDFSSAATNIFGQQGPVFVNLKVEPEIENLPVEQRKPQRGLTVQYPVVKKAISRE